MKRVSVTILILLLAASILFLPPVSTVNAETGYTVGTSTVSAINVLPPYPKQGVFYAADRWWVFFISTDTDLVYATSSDGVTWSGTTLIGTAYLRYGAAVYFDGTYIYYIRWPDDSSLIYFRRGTPESNGAISWSSSEQQFPVLYNDIWGVSIGVDTDGYAWVLTTQRSTNYYVYLYKNKFNNGTWYTDTGYPQLMRQYSSTYTPYIAVHVLSSNRLYFMWGVQSDPLYGRLWDGTTLQSEETITTSLLSSYTYLAVSACVDASDNIYVAFSTTTITNRLRFVKRTYGVGWGSESTITDGIVYFTITIDHTTGQLWVFWHTGSFEYGPPGSVRHKIYNQTSVNGGVTWTSFQVWLDETAQGIIGSAILSTRKEYNDKVAIVYVTKSASPFNIRFAKFSSAGNAAPTVGQFEAPDEAYPDDYFDLKARVRDPDGYSELKNTTLVLSHGVTLLWEASGNSFSVYSDPNGYCTIDTASCKRLVVNSTSYELTWHIKLGWTYPEGTVSVSATVYDSSGASGTGSEDELFSFLNRWSVGTSTTIHAIDYPYQRRSAYVEGLFWLFYCNGSHIVYGTYSTGDESWSEPTAVRECTEAPSFSVWFNDADVYLAYANSSEINYLHGTLDGGGVVAWDVNATIGTVFNEASSPFIAVDTKGYVWIAYVDEDGADDYAYVIKSGNNDTSWGSTPDGFPYQLSSTADSTWKPSIIPLSDGAVYALYSRDGEPPKGKLWNGSWGGQESVASDIDKAYAYSIVADQDTDSVYLVLSEETTGKVQFYSRNASAWSGSAVTLATVSGGTCPMLAVDFSGDLYAAWFDTSDAYIRYMKRSGDAWDGEATKWVLVTMTAPYTTSLFYQSYEDRVGLFMQMGVDSPYTIYFTYLVTHYPVNIACSATATFVGDTYAWLNVTVYDIHGHNHLHNVTVTVQTPPEYNFVLMWTQAGNSTSEVYDPENVVEIDGTAPASIVLNATTVKVMFHFKVRLLSEVLNGYCDVVAKTTNDYAISAEDVFANVFRIYIYWPSPLDDLLAAIQAAFNYFGVPNGIDIFMGLINASAAYLEAAVAYVIGFLAPLFNLFAGIAFFIIDWFGRIVTLFLQIASIVKGILDGTYTVTTGLGNIWAMINLNDWVDVIPIFILVAWFCSIDSRAKTHGGWMSVFWGDVQAIISVISFIFDMSMTIMNMVIDLIYKFIHIIPGT